MFALFAVLLAKLEAQTRDSLADRVSRGAQNVATGVEARVQNMIVTVDVLSSAAELVSGDLNQYYRRTRAVLREGSLFLIMVDDSGRQLFNTRVPYGTALGPTSNMAALHKALSSSKVVVSDAFFGRTSQKWVFNVILPLRKSGLPVSGALILTQNADNLLPGVNLEDGWQTAVIDQTGRVLDATGMASGRRISDALLNRLNGGSGTIEADMGGGDTLVGYARMGGIGWSALYWPPASATRPATSPLFSALFGGFVILMLIGLGLAYLLSQTLRNAVGSIVHMARQAGEGRVVEPVQTPIIEADIVSQALADAARKRLAAEDHLQLVLRELAHRTKNLISVVQALISQGARQSGAPRDMFLPLMERLSGLGRSIDLMTGADWTAIPLRALVERQLQPFGDLETRFTISGPEVALKADAVQNMGLILHELATNAMKFGALSVPEGTVTLDWRSSENDDGTQMLEIRWREENGPPASRPTRSGFGATVLTDLATGSFGGRVCLDYATEGFSWTLVAPRENFTG